NGATNYRIDQIKLADGTVWDVDHIKEQALQASDSEGDDLIQGYSSADTLLGLGGDDTIIGNAGNDTLDGG
ncbi:calcium-binding protein, partial [Psychrobacter sp. TB55-MNA-CIBAN-0194]|uniref:calcium-binding protein n=1 Tax=Psychrobacter sp. TB55-MNA-CIBAN-0194 TaxID=3140445 RepID=UPI00332383D6